jgi:hypothetical protein
MMQSYSQIIGSRQEYGLDGKAAERIFLVCFFSSKLQINLQLLFPYGSLAYEQLPRLNGKKLIVVFFRRSVSVYKIKIYKNPCQD